MPKKHSVALCAALALIGTPLWADEGMWTFNNFPAEQVKQAYGFEPSPAWLDHLRLAAVRIAGGCSASLVSPQGLVMTNHHCARDCIENLSGLTKKDFNLHGFFAKTGAEEARCPGMEINQLTAITEVTQRVQAATRDVPADRFADAQKAAMAAIEKECATSDEWRCDVVSLYRGGRYDLYKYKRYQDVRLVFAPEDSIASFGGDPDNFMFPRYDLDVSFLRVYDRGQPLQTHDYLAWSDGRLREGDATFVAGNPGGTSRGLTVAQLQDDRDQKLPFVMMRVAEQRGFIAEYQARGAEQKRHSNDLLFGIENKLKAVKGRHDALADPVFFAQLVQGEKALRERVQADPALAARYGGVWDAIAALVQKEDAYRKEYEAIEHNRFPDLFALARDLVRYGDESVKPNGERLKEYTDARLPQVKQHLLSNWPIYDELEIARLSWTLTKIREDLGPDHPVIKQVFGRRSPEQIATAAVRGTTLKDLKTDRDGNAIGGARKRLFDGGKPAIDASKDPIIALARALDPFARAIRHKMEVEVDGPMKQQQELLAQARFAVYGMKTYPDATFTPRVSYGAVQGYQEGATRVQPFTTIAGAFERHTGADPFALPPSWLQARPKLDPNVPFNFVTTNDIIGGNSGSPMVNRNGEVVGLVFDGNIESLGGEYGFGPAVNRTVAVHSSALLEAMGKVYGADRLVREIQSGTHQAVAHSDGGATTQR